MSDLNAAKQTLLADLREHSVAAGELIAATAVEAGASAVGGSATWRFRPPAPRSRCP